MVGGHVLMTTTVLSAYIIVLSHSVWNHASDLRVITYRTVPGKKHAFCSGARPTHASAPRICAAFSRTEHAHIQIHN